jgi:hypothetical protein
MDRDKIQYLKKEMEDALFQNIINGELMRIEIERYEKMLS